MREKTFFLILSLCILPLLILNGCEEVQPVTAELDEKNYYDGNINDFLKQPKLKVEPQWKPVKAKGIYLTGWSAGSERFDFLLKKVEETELNAMVIDIKDATGRITFQSKVPLAVDIGANSDKIADMKQLLNVLHENNIYPIARIVVFKDPVLARAKPEWAIHNKKGGIWKDNKGLAWLNPYNQQVWKYIVDLAVEAAKLGFKEIQFDYVRFPTDGNLKNIVYPEKMDLARSLIIKEFLSYARKRLEPRGIYVSADVFGLVTSAKDDMKIGQILEEVAEEVDYICPMVYPSHYARGSYGIADPNASPYETVFQSLKHAVERLEKLETNRAIIRPWLQDFSLGYRYGIKEVKAQIQATYDVGLEEWILWNPANLYTWDALEQESPDQNVIKEGTWNQ